MRRHPIYLLIDSMLENKDKTAHRMVPVTNYDDGTIAILY